MPTGGSDAAPDRPRAWMSWSSGKDSAFALERARRSGSVEIVGLLTTITETFDRVSMHGVREPLLDAQARALGLPLEKVRIPFPCPNERYEEAMREALARAARAGVRTVVFGDLYLEDLRSYREERMRSIGFSAQFPLWTSDTPTLAREMIRAGVEARICCLDPRKVPRELAGHRFDDELLERLPPSVDPCGERGEFHTFVSWAPGFERPVPVHVGPSVERDGFLFTDLQSAD